MLTVDVVAALLLSGGLLCWPSAAVRHRLSGVRSPWVGPRVSAPLFRFAPLVPMGGVILVALVAGVGTGIALLLLGLAAGLRWRDKRDNVWRLRTVAGMAAAVRSLVSALRAGAHPALAAEAVAEDAEPAASRALRKVAATARLGGDVRTVRFNDSESDRTAVADPVMRMSLRRVTTTWAVAQRYGIGLTELLEAVRRDLEHRHAFARDIEARMAGPRATGVVLSLLPLLGVGIGQAMGASPLAVLFGSAIGQVLLVLGVVLGVLGVLWTSKLTTSAVWS